MLAASLSLTGTHRILMDILEWLDPTEFTVLVAYKPDFPGPGNDLLPSIEELNFKVFPLPGCHLFNIKGLKEIHRIVSKHEVDIIHCWDSLSIMARLIGKIDKISVIDSVGNPPVNMSKKEYLGKKFSSLFLDGIVFQSKGTQELHHKHGGNILRWCKEKVIYNCINLQKIPKYDSEIKNKIRKKYNLNKNDNIITNLGMYNVQKSQEYIIQALPTTLKHNKNIKLLLIGWGDRLNFLKSQIESFGLRDKVILTGKKQKNEVFELLSITDIYVSSSQWEGLPIAILEAMAFGIPVVATNVVGNREVVIDNENGYLVPERNPTALGEAISRLIENSEIKKRMGDAGKERAARVFNPERFIGQYQAFYKSILGWI